MVSSMLSSIVTVIGVANHFALDAGLSDSHEQPPITAGSADSVHAVVVASIFWACITDAIWICIFGFLQKLALSKTMGA